MYNVYTKKLVESIHHKNKLGRYNMWHRSSSSLKVKEGLLQYTLNQNLVRNLTYGKQLLILTKNKKNFNSDCCWTYIFATFYMWNWILLFNKNQGILKKCISYFLSIASRYKKGTVPHPDTMSNCIISFAPFNFIYYWITF